jgi:hypothetical protein
MVGSPRLLHICTLASAVSGALRDMSRSAQYCPSNWTILLVSQESSYPPNQTACPLEAGL